MESLKNTKIVRSAFTVFFSVMISLGAFLSLELPGGIPITIQNMFAVLAGLLLGGLQGAGAVGLFIIVGVAGVPVFSGCKGGLSVLQGPTGGYLIGYFIGALVGGLIIGSPITHEKKSPFFIGRLMLATLAAFTMPYLSGIPWYISTMEAAGNVRPLSQVLSVALFPFIPGDCIKIVLSFFLSLVFRPFVARYLYPDDTKEAEMLLKKLENRKEKHRR